jgi:hypothetical protein
MCVSRPFWWFISTATCTKYARMPSLGAALAAAPRTRQHALYCSTRQGTESAVQHSVSTRLAHAGHVRCCLGSLLRCLLRLGERNVHPARWLHHLKRAQLLHHTQALVNILTGRAALQGASKAHGSTRLHVLDAIADAYGHVLGCVALVQLEIHVQSQLLCAARVRGHRTGTRQPELEAADAEQSRRFALLTQASRHTDARVACFRRLRRRARALRAGFCKACTHTGAPEPRRTTKSTLRWNAMFTRCGCAPSDLGSAARRSGGRSRRACVKPQSSAAAARSRQPRTASRCRCCCRASFPRHCRASLTSRSTLCGAKARVRSQPAFELRCRRRCSVAPASARQHAPAAGAPASTPSSRFSVSGSGSSPTARQR